MSMVELPRLDPENPALKTDTLKRLEWTLAIALSVLVLFLLGIRATHAGGLWRDEATTVQLARMSSWSEIEQTYQFYSHPLLVPFLVRVYTAVATDTDSSLRIFGFLVGAALLGIAWFSARVINRSVPLILPALVGLNITFLTVGTSIRGYGLGSILIVLAFSLTASLLTNPVPRRFAATLLAYLAAAHCVFFDIAYVAAIAVAAAVVFLLRRRFKSGLTILLLAGVCAVSYMPYLVRFLKSKDWIVILTYPQNQGWFWRQFLETAGAPTLIMPWIWLTVVLLAIGAAGQWLAVNWHSKIAPDLLLFGILSIFLALPAHFALAQLLHDPLPRPRYYLALFCFVAAAADLVIAVRASQPWLRLTRLAIVGVAIVVQPIFSWTQITKRETNIDFLAAHLNQNAAANDLIVVNPWYLGVSFYRYYHGRAQWITVPTMDDHRTHRYDLMKARMLETDPLGDVRRAILETLNNGGQLWLVGGAALPQSDKPVWPLPAPDPELGWSNESYSIAWSQQLGEFLRTHVSEAENVAEPDPGVHSLENVGLLVARGWQD